MNLETITNYLRARPKSVAKAAVITALAVESTLCYALYRNDKPVHGAAVLSIAIITAWTGYWMRKSAGQRESANKASAQEPSPNTEKAKTYAPKDPPYASSAERTAA